MILLSAIAGDLLGSTYEFRNFRGSSDTLHFFPAGSFATDDSVLTCAVAHTLIKARRQDGTIDKARFSERLPDALRRFASCHPEAGYGGRFAAWLKIPHAPAYGSLGNGSAMRVCACAWTGQSTDTALELARLCALPTHNHPLGVLGAVATVAAIERLKNGKSGREMLINEWDEKFGALGTLPDVESLHAPIAFDATCPGTVPFAVALALNSCSWEDAVRRAVAMGGDCDTTAAIAGAVAGGAYPVPESIACKALSLLSSDLRRVVLDFEATFEKNAAGHMA